MQTYCLFCKVAQEEKVMSALQSLGYSCFSPMETNRRYVNGTIRQREKRLLPGYVFIDAETDIADWGAIMRVPDIFRILEYGDGVRALRGGDLEFAAWLRRQNGVIEITRVMLAGTKIRVVDGPLLYYEGKIVAVNKKRKVVAIEIGEAERLRKVWCPVEYVEETE